MARKKLEVNRQKKGQVWVETVIYTLIALTLIGAVLAFAKPKIEEAQDKALIEGSVAILNSIDNEMISVVQGGPGNRRVIEINLREGQMIIDGDEDNVIYEIESRYQYSEPGKDVKEGNIIARTESLGDMNEITLTANYSRYDVVYEGEDVENIVNPSPNTQRLIISNEGSNDEEEERIKINFRVE